MKKYIILLLSSFFALGANAKIWLVDNNSINFLTSVQAALDSTNISGGDTVMVFGSATSYGDVIINNPVVLIGEGMNNIYGENSIFNLIEIRCSDVYISGVESGIRLQSTWAPLLTLSNILIERSRLNPPTSSAGIIKFNGQSFGQSGFGKFKNIVFRNNLLENGGCYLHDLNGAGYYPFVEIDSVVFENNIFDNVRFVRETGAGNLIGLDKLYIVNNNFIRCVSNPYIFANAFGNLNITDATVENNIFHTSNPQACVGCIYNNNLSFNNGANDSITTGVGNIIGNPDFVGYTSGVFNFQDFNLNASSPAIGSGTTGTNIGTTGGIYPLAIGEGARIPLVETINLSNFAEPQLQDIFLDLTARARRNFNDTEIFQEIKYSFDSIMPFGQGTDLIPLTQGLNVSYIDSISPPPFVLDSGLHTITFIARDSKGAYSFPRTYLFNVCTYNEVVADYDYYLYGRDVIFANNSKLAEDYYWDFGDGNTSTQLNPVNHYVNAATYTVSLSSSNPCFSETYEQTFLIRGINSVSPLSGGNIGVVTMTVTGAGFSDSTYIYLRQAATTISSIDSSTTFFEDKTIQTTFNLNGQATGLWDVVIVVPGDTTYELLSYFTIETGTKPIPQVALVGNKAFRAFFPHKMSIEVTNTGNTNAMIVPIWFAVPDFVNIELLFDLVNPPDTNVVDWDTIPNYFISDSVLGRFGNFKVFNFLISSIAPSEVVQLPFEISSNIGSQFEFLLWSGKPWLYTDSLEMYKMSSSNNCAIDAPQMNCLLCIAGNAPTSGCIGTIGVNVLGPLVNYYCYGDPDLSVMDGVKAAASIGLSCGLPALFPGSAILQLVELALEMDDEGLGGCINPCLDALPPFIPDSYVLQGLLSMDPNYKAGISGALGSPYVNSIHPLEYTIHFENIDTATASAQTVTLIDTLDNINLDLNTFQLTSIGFGDTIITIPSGRKSFTTNVDLQPNLPLIVEISAFLNNSTGIFTTTYKSLDPTTMEPTTNPFLGFLLPNDSTGRGEGFVSFSVKADISTASGTVINNKAAIYFDYNPPITTQTWTNIIDNLNPQSQIISLTQISNTDSLVVNWTSSDSGPAGVYTHNVFYNVNGGDWLLWKYNTSLNSDVFVGILDSTYGFYSVAIDSALNIEDAPFVADVITTLINIEELNHSQMIVKLFPNPASSTTNIFIKPYDKSKSEFRIIISDVTGRTVYIENLNITTESKTIQLDISQLESGLYYFEITDGENRTFKKLTIN